MGWKEPGNQGNGKDPWGNQSGPPDLDEALKQFQDKLKGFLGGGNNGGSNFVGGSSSGGFKLFGYSVIAVIAIGLYLISGVFIVQPAEKAVITRFGQYVDEVGAGPHWIPRFIDKKIIVNVQVVDSIKFTDNMLTKEGNIVNAGIAIQYRIDNPRDYLFNVVDPRFSLQQVTESALRGVVGQSKLGDVLSEGRQDIGLKIRDQIASILEFYKSGLVIEDIALQKAKAPDPVQAAFTDVINAQLDKERLVIESNAYRNRVVPIAEGMAKRKLEEAKAYKQQVTLNAQGDTARFEKLLPEYQKAPGITRERIYFETLQDVYVKTPKVLIDVEGGNNLMYLPLDKLMTTKSNLIAPEIQYDHSGQAVQSPSQVKSEKSSNYSDFVRTNRYREGYQR